MADNSQKGDSHIPHALTVFRRSSHQDLRAQFLALLSGEGQPAVGDIHFAGMASSLVPSPLSRSTVRWIANGCQGFPSEETVQTPTMTITLIFLCKRAKVEGASTADLRLRIEAGYRLLHDGKIPTGAQVHIVFTGHKGEAAAAKREFENLLNMYALPIDRTRIHFHLEPKGSDTTENIRESCKLLRKEEITPDIVVICSTDWHVLRLFFNCGMVPEKAELPIILQYFPKARIVLLMAPYPYREPTMLAWSRWQAEVHVQTHFMAPLVTLLYAIAEGLVQEVRENVVKLFLDAFDSIEKLMVMGEARDENNAVVRKAWEANHAAFCDVRHEIIRLCGQTIKNHKTFDLRGPDGIKYNCAQFAVYVKKLIEAVRFPSDPDRT